MFEFIIMKRITYSFHATREFLMDIEADSAMAPANSDIWPVGTEAAASDAEVYNTIYNMVLQPANDVLYHKLYPFIGQSITPNL